MTLDSIARASAEALLDATRSAGHDPEALGGLLRAHRRRRRTRGLAAVSATVLALLVGAVLLAPSSRRETTPAQHDGPGTIVTVGGTIARDTVILRHGSDVTSISRVGDHALRFVQDLAVDRGGERIALVADEHLFVASLDGHLLWSLRCGRTCLWVDWTAGNDLVLVTADRAGSLVDRRFTEDGASRGTLDLPTGASGTGLSPDGDQVVGVEPATRRPDGRDTSSTVFVSDRDGSHRVDMPASTVPRGWTVVDAQWAPGAAHLGLLLQGPPRGENDQTEYVLRTIRPDGTDLTQVADLGRCLCLGWFPPTFAWSPDGAGVVAVRVPDGSNGPPPEPVVLDLEGNETGPSVGGGSPVDWGPAPAS